MRENLKKAILHTDFRPWNPERILIDFASRSVVSWDKLLFSVYRRRFYDTGKFEPIPFELVRVVPKIIQEIEDVSLRDRFSSEMTCFATGIIRKCQGQQKASSNPPWKEPTSSIQMKENTHNVQLQFANGLSVHLA